jgi:hypothetical protein
MSVWILVPRLAPSCLSIAETQKPLLLLEVYLEKTEPSATWTSAWRLAQRRKSLTSSLQSLIPQPLFVSREWPGATHARDLLVSHRE